MCVCDLSRGREGVFACVQVCMKVCVTFLGGKRIQRGGGNDNIG